MVRESLLSGKRARAVEKLMIYGRVNFIGGQAGTVPECECACVLSYFRSRENVDSYGASTAVRARARTLFLRRSTDTEEGDTEACVPGRARSMCQGEKGSLCDASMRNFDIIHGRTACRCARGRVLEGLSSQIWKANRESES